jgi:hypothetical protein
VNVIVFPAELPVLVQVWDEKQLEVVFQLAGSACAVPMAAAAKMTDMKMLARIGRIPLFGDQPARFMPALRGC